jgi:cytochrome P450
MTSINRMTSTALDRTASPSIAADTSLTAADASIAADASHAATAASFPPATAPLPSAAATRPARADMPSTRTNTPSTRTSLPPGPRLPRLLQTRLLWQRPIPFLAANRRKYGPVYTIRALPWGKAVVVDDAELVKQIFTGDPAIFHAGEGNSMLAPVLGERSVLVIDEDEHLQARKRLLPPFHGESVRRYGETIERIVAAEAASWPVDEPFALHPRMRAITLEVILEAVIGVSDPVRLRGLRETLPAIADIGLPIMAMWVIGPLRYFGPWRRYRHTVMRANELLREEIAARRLAPDLDQREDVLSQLVRAGETDDGELRDQIVTLLMAGHETTTTGLAWAMERLLRHPEILAKAKAGDDAYLDAVIKETLRVRPVIPAVLRTLTRPVTLGDWTLPAGITLMPAITLMHEDPHTFPDPKRFRPERFLDDEEGSTYTWIPFGGGRRRCLGAAFASFEMRVALRTILRDVALRPADARDERVRSHHITLVPARGARVIREARA